MISRRLSLALLSMVPASLLSSGAAIAQESESEKNKRLVVGFYNKAFNEGDIDGALKDLGETYIQHNPMVPDGPAALRGFLMMRKDRSPQARSYIKRAIADKDLVVLHVHAVPEPGARGLAIVDIFRVENGKIVEHWDVIQPVPESAKNSNTMF